MNAEDCMYLKKRREEPDYCLYSEKYCPCILDPRNLFYLPLENCGMFEEKENDEVAEINPKTDAH